MSLSRLLLGVMLIINGVIAAPFFWRWLNRSHREILHQPSGLFQRLPHIVLGGHLALSVAMLLGREPLSWIPYANLPAGPVTGLISGFGLGLFAIGSWLRLDGLYRHGANFEKDVLIREGHRLQTEGAYRFGRHPMYSGNLLCELGMGLGLGCWPLIAMTLSISMPLWNLRAEREEQLLLNHFGEPYRRYMETVRRWWPGR